MISWPAVSPKTRPSGSGATCGSDVAHATSNGTRTRRVSASLAALRWTDDRGVARETGDLRLAWLDTQVRANPARRGYGTAPALAHPGARGMAQAGCRRTVPVLRGPSSHGHAAGVSGTHTPRRGSPHTTAPPASSHDLAADGSTRNTGASRPPHSASVSRATPARYDPRQQPGAVMPHAGIGAGGAGSPASLPRPTLSSLGLDMTCPSPPMGSAISLTVGSR